MNATSAEVSSGAQSFRIRRVFLLPLGLLLAVSLALLAVVILQGQTGGKIIILGIMIIPVAVILVESLARRAEVGDDAVTVHKFLRDKSLRYADLTEVESVVVRKRAFLSLSTEEHFLIISNAYDDFPRLVQTLLARVPAGVITEQARAMAANPPTKSSDIVSCWLAVALMSLILAVQFFAQG